MSDDDLQLKITAEDQSAPAFQSVERNLDSFSQLMLAQTRDLAAEIGKVTLAVTGIGDALAKQGHQIQAHAHETHQHLSSMEDGFNHVGKSIEEAFSAETIIGELGTSFFSVLAPLALVEAGVEAVHKAMEELYEFSKEGIVKADEIRDLGLSLGVLTGSAHRGAEAMEFFERNADKTRNTAEELGKSFRNLAPLMESRGFSGSAQQSTTMMLSQLASMRGVNMDEMESGFRQLLAGRVSPGRNLLLQTLGITKADADSLGWDTLITKMREVTSHFPEFGQSFESELHKIQESLVVSFAEGFNDARGSAKSGMDGIRSALEDPEVRGAIKEFGSFVSSILHDATMFGTGVVASLHAIGEAAGPAGAALAEAFGWFIKNASGIQSIIDYGEEQRAKSVSASNIAQQKAWYGTGGDALARAGMASGIRTGAGWEKHGFWDGFQSQVGNVKGQTTDVQFEKFIESLKHAAHDGIITLKEYQKARAEALKPEGVPDDKIKQDAEKLDAARKEAAQLSAQMHKLGDEWGYAAQKALSSNPVFDAYLESQQKITSVNDQAAAAMVKLEDAFGKIGYSPEVLSALHNLNEMVRIGHELANAELNEKLLNFLHAQPFMKELARTAPGAPLTAAEQNAVANRHEADRLMAFGPDNLEVGQSFADLTRQAFKESTDRLRQQVHAAFSDGADLIAAALTGGSKGFMEAVQRDFSSLVGDASRTGLEALFEHMGGVGRGDAKLGQDPKKFYYAGGSEGFSTASGAAMASPFGRNTAQVMGFAEIGLGAYSASAAGPGQRTASTIGGAASGAALGAQMGSSGGPYGAIVGAVIGAIVGAAGGAAGAAARQDQYKFAQFGISAGGYAYGYGNFNGNINKQEMTQYLERIQQVHDQTRDAMIRLTMTFPGYKIPGLPAGQVLQPGQVGAGLGALYGGIPADFQDKQSQTFKKHLDAWISPDLPQAEMKVFSEELQRDFGSIGISTAKFTEVWGRLSKIDPSQAIQYLQQWADAWVSLNKSLTFFGGEPSFQALFGDNRSHTFETETMRLAGEDHRTYGSHLAENDKDIISFAAGIHNLSLEGQIAAEQELANRVQQRYDYEKQAIADIYAAQKQERESYLGSKDQISLARMMKDDGSADYYAQAVFGKQRADAEMNKLGASANAGDLTNEWNKVQQWIQMTGNAGLQQASSVDQKQAWYDWMSKMLDEADRVFNARATQLGVDINNANDQFEKQFGPILDPLRTLASTTKDVNDGLGGTGERIPIFNRDLDNATVSLDGLSSNLTILTSGVQATAAAHAAATDAVNTFVSALLGAAATLNNIAAGNNGLSSGQSFAARTAIARSS